MLHERLQADIVSENSLGGLANAAIAARGVRGGGVELREQEACLRAAGVTYDEARQREAVLDEFLVRRTASVTLSFSRERF